MGIAHARMYIDLRLIRDYTVKVRSCLIASWTLDGCLAEHC